MAKSADRRVFLFRPRFWEFIDLIACIFLRKWAQGSWCRTWLDEFGLIHVDRAFIKRPSWCQFSVLLWWVEWIRHDAIEDFWLRDMVFLCLASFADYFLERILIVLENNFIFFILIPQSLEVWLLLRLNLWEGYSIVSDMLGLSCVNHRLELFLCVSIRLCLKLCLWSFACEITIIAVDIWVKGWNNWFLMLLLVKMACFTTVDGFIESLAWDFRLRFCLLHANLHLILIF